jgi:hypothetical protein
MFSEDDVTALVGAIGSSPPARPNLLAVCSGFAAVSRGRYSIQATGRLDGLTRWTSGTTLEAAFHIPSPAGSVSLRASALPSGKQERRARHARVPVLVQACVRAVPAHALASPT